MCFLFKLKVRYFHLTSFNTAPWTLYEHKKSDSLSFVSKVHLSVKVGVLFLNYLSETIKVRVEELGHGGHYGFVLWMVIHCLNEK